MSLAEYLDSIKHLNYVVQRNWEGLPSLDPEHPDLDLFVSEEDYAELNVLTPYDFVDIRRPGDNYYPPEVGGLLLKERRLVDGYWVPSPQAHFISLFYHAVVHKSENKYQDQLKKSFLEWIKPVKADDPGVGYYI